MPRRSSSFTLSIEHDAVIKLNHLKETLNIMENRENINSIDNEGNATLHLVIKLGYLDIVKLLIENRADVNIKDQHDNTPLHISALYGQVAIAEELLKHGADIKAKNITGGTPLHSAVYFKPKVPIPKNLHMAHLGVMPKLIRWGADREAENNQGHTPYKLAIHINNMEMADELLKRGAHDPCSRGFTPSFRPVRAGSSGSQSSFSLEPSSSGARQGSNRL